MIDYSSKRFLVVDDFSDFQSAVKGMLRQMAVSQIDTAANGQESLALCQKNRYDIILHDYNLGAGKSGQQVLEELHHNNWLSPHCIFLMVTAESSQAMVMGALECEPDAYLTKPFNRASLQQRLDKLVERKQALKPILDAQAKGDWKGMLTACQELVSSQKRYLPQIHRHMAMALEQLGQTAALQQLLQGIVDDRPLPWALVRLARLLAAKHPEQARDLYEKGMQLFPMMPALYDGLAELEQLQGSPEKAQQWLEQGLRISPHALQRQAELGRLARLNEDYDTAVRAFRQTVELGRHSAFRSPEHHFGLSASLNDQTGDKPLDPRAQAEICKSLDEVKRQWSDDPQLQVRSGLLQARTLHNSGQPEAAAKLAAEMAVAIEQIPEFFSADVALEVAGELRRLGQADSAEQLLGNCAEIHGDDPQVLQRIGALTDNQQIIDLAGKALAVNQEGIRAYREHHYDQALEAFRKAQQLQPRNISFALNAAQSLLRVAAEGNNAELFAEAREGLRRIAGIPRDDQRYERYVKLRELAEKG